MRSAHDGSGHMCVHSAYEVGSRERVYARHVRCKYNDAIKKQHAKQFILFADDTNIFYSCSIISQLFDTVNIELCKFFHCFHTS